MSTTINVGWLKDNNGDKFAPKTLSSQVMTADGTTLESKIENDLSNLETNKADADHNHDDVYAKVEDIPESISIQFITWEEDD